MARRLHSYFKAHIIEVLTSYPLLQLLHKPSTSGRLTKWAVELREFDIKFTTATTIKAQVMTNFLAELVPREEVEEKEWRFFIDVLVSKKGGGIEVIVVGPREEKIKHIEQLAFLVTNNEADYEAFLTSLKITEILKVKNLEIITNSQLVAKQA